MDGNKPLLVSGEQSLDKIRKLKVDREMGTGPTVCRSPSMSHEPVSLEATLIYKDQVV